MIRVNVRNKSKELYQRRIALYNQTPKKCKHCKSPLPYEKRGNTFCSKSCSAKYNNRGICRHGAKRIYFECLNCGKELAETQKKYCSHHCQAKYQHKTYIEKWTSGIESGFVGGNVLSRHIRQWLFEKYNDSCAVCGWNKINQYTGKIPLHIHHIDGDWENNRPENLQLLCPNCHSLTTSYGGANRGNGRPYVVYKK